ncbi:MAG: hypothetical protein E7591_07010 [Ruminococcaceae bacterium]|nr:hypothetical protein [Oscillospiraceae bacterium]
MQSKPEEFFASANSGYGFINMFADAFKDLEHLYIIKGGSGTGKSSFMKRAAKYAQKRGYRVEYCLCSSDPDSIDGIIIHGIEVGIIDGTSPHNADTKYPGAYDEIINTGDFWNSGILIKKRDKIEKLTDYKQMLYKRSYLFLKAALCIESAYDSIIAPAVNQAKLRSAVSRIYKSIDPSKTGGTSIRISNAITMKGYVTLNRYESCKSIYKLDDRYGISHIFLNELEAMLTENRIMHTVSLCPLDTNKINGIYLDECDMLFTTEEYGNIRKRINTQRFVFTDKADTAVLRRLKKQRSTLLNEAYGVLKEIKDIHFTLEGIYSSAMDFEALNAYTEMLLPKIIK